MAALQRLTGQVLVASPTLQDPNFERSVVLVLADGEMGSLGVVLNRATEVTVDEVLDGWEPLAVSPGVVFEGGPVQPDAVICLGMAKPRVRQVAGFSEVNGFIGTVDLSHEPDEMRPALSQIRVFSGYAGWSPGQLHTEVSEGSWLVLDSNVGDAFTPDPEDLWSDVLKRQGGMVSALAHYPADLSLN